MNPNIIKICVVVPIYNILININGLRLLPRRKITLTHPHFIIKVVN